MPKGGLRRRDTYKEQPFGNLGFQDRYGDVKTSREAVLWYRTSERLRIPSMLCMSERRSRDVGSPATGGQPFMLRGDKSKYTDKQERKADHIAEGY
jgi:hypothetical protein